MGKLSQDLPQEMRPFFKHMEQVAYRHNYSEVFNDFLIMCINAFSFPGSSTEADRDQAFKKYSDKEKQGMNGMFQELILVQDKMICKDDDWYDPFGNLYQAISSNYKASGMGQFFTPESVVNMMVQMTAPKGPYLTIGEPCAGSGRMILACHALQPLNFYYAADLDSMCMRMTALNMALHNASGVVHHMNTLSMEWYGSYIIDRVKLAENKWFPVIKPATKEEADQWWWGVSEWCRIMKGTPREPEKFSTEKALEALEAVEEKIEALPVEPKIKEQIKQEVTKRKKFQNQLTFDF